MYKAASTGKNIGWVDLGLLPAGAGTPYSLQGDWSRANGINNLGIMVGQSTMYIPWGFGGRKLVNRAFVLSNSGSPGSEPMIDLTAKTDVFENGNWQTAASQGWAILDAERINDNNWIVGTAQQGSTIYAVLLTPR